MRRASNLFLCKTHPAVSAVAPGGQCPGDNYSYGKTCKAAARWSFRGVRRCTAHTASVLHDLPMRGAA